MRSRTTVMLIFAAPLLIVAITLGVYATVKANSLLLPVPTLSLALSLVLPILTLLSFFLPSGSGASYPVGPLTENASSGGVGNDNSGESRSLTVAAGGRHTQQSPRQQRGHLIRRHAFSWLPSILPRAWLGHGLAGVLAVVLGTLSGSALFSDGDELRRCALRHTWQLLFSAHDAAAVRGLQDAFRCCGLNKPTHQAWPFPGGRDRVPADACLRRYPDDPARRNGCIGPWSAADRRVQGALLGCAIALAVVQALRAYLDPAAAPTRASAYVRLGGDRGEPRWREANRHGVVTRRDNHDDDADDVGGGHGDGFDAERDAGAGDDHGGRYTDEPQAGSADSQGGNTAAAKPVSAQS